MDFKGVKKVAFPQEKSIKPQHYIYLMNVVVGIFFFQCKAEQYMGFEERELLHTKFFI